MKTSTLAKSLLVAASLPLLAGCVVYERQPVAVAPPPGAPRSAEVVVTQPYAPPPLQVEVIPPQPNVAFVWIPGCWDWRGHWVWIEGRWAPPPRPHAVWVTGRWARRHNGYVWVAGHWR
jgi:hypothetical protein